MQDLRGTSALRTLARGSNELFTIFIMDAGFQVFGNVTHNDENYKDFRELADEEGAIFLGKYNVARRLASIYVH